MINTGNLKNRRPRNSVCPADSRAESVKSIIGASLILLTGQRINGQPTQPILVKVIFEMACDERAEA